MPIAVPDFYAAGPNDAQIARDIAGVVAADPWPDRPVGTAPCRRRSLAAPDLGRDVDGDGDVAHVLILDDRPALDE